MRSCLAAIGVVLAASICGCGLALERPEPPRNWDATVWIENGDSFGCGVVIWENGLILTAAHVVAEDGPVTVIMSDEADADKGIRLPADVIATSKDDLALLRVKHHYDETVRISDANDSKPGDPIYGVMVYPVFGKIVGRGAIARTHFSFVKRDAALRDMLMVHYPGMSGSSGSGVYRASDGALLGINRVVASMKTESGDLEMNLVVPGYGIIKFLDSVGAPYHPARPSKPASPRKKWSTDDHTDPS